MRAIAEFAMKSHGKAVAVILGAAILPLAFWLSAAVVGLVILRKGLSEGHSTLLLGAVPALAFHSYTGAPVVIAVYIVVMMMAMVLRASVSWRMTLIVSSILGFLVSWVLVQVIPEPSFREMHQQLAQVLSESMGANAPAAEDPRWLWPLVQGAPGFVVMLVSFGCLAVARWWQASLYNPGGFQQEFHSIRLPLAFTLPLLLVVFLGYQWNESLMTWVPVLLVPLVIGGLSVVHALVKLKGWSWPWLAVVYFLLVAHSLVVGPLLILLAVLDGFFDLRQRVKDKV